MRACVIGRADRQEHVAQIARDRAFIDRIGDFPAFDPETRCAARIIAAVVYLPIRGKLYAAALGAGATLNDVAIRTSAARHLHEAEVLATKHTLGPAHWPQGVPPVTRAYRPSLAYRMALVGEGRFDAMITFRQTWEWDIAAGALIIAEAGGLATDAMGQPLRFNAATPKVAGVLAAAPDLHAALMGARGPGDAPTA